MIYPHQQQAIDYIEEKFRNDSGVLALLLSGSIAHGFNTERSDVDLNIVVSAERYAELAAAGKLTYWESAEAFYPGGYFDGKFISLDYLELVRGRGNEPTRFALHDARILFDRTGEVSSLLKAIAAYPAEGAEERKLRFLGQLRAWKWYCDEALKAGNPYLLDTALPRMILFGGRLLLTDNGRFYPYHKWFMRVLGEAPDLPEGLMASIDRTLRDKTEANIEALFMLFNGHKSWTNEEPFDWPSRFVGDVETKWMSGDDYIENM